MKSKLIYSTIILTLLNFTGCAISNTAGGALAGAVAGGAIGSTVGNHRDAMIGAAGGAVAGAIVGREMDDRNRR